jgi:hypothetical protein
MLPFRNMNYYNTDKNTSVYLVLLKYALPEQHSKTPILLQQKLEIRKNAVSFHDVVQVESLITIPLNPYKRSNEGDRGVLR